MAKPGPRYHDTISTVTHGWISLDFLSVTIMPCCHVSQVNPACSAQSLVVADLIGGEEYLFRVRAENRFGFGPYAETVDGSMARDPIRMSTTTYDSLC